jgi:5'-3' exonuclease
MDVHLIDGTYELFRHYYAVPPRQDAGGQEVGAMLGVMNSVLGMLRGGATHIGIATDHVIESFRNTMYPGYKTGEGIDPALWRQFHPLEDALRAMGVVVWAMVDEEADDALAAAAKRAASDRRVTRVFICTPDKDLAQCVSGTRVVQLDRRSNTVRDESGVREKFGVDPESIPDYLALVGDSADGFPGISGFGAKTAATLLGRHRHLEDIPHDPAAWPGGLRNTATLSATLRSHWSDAILFRNLATLRDDLDLFASIDALEWKSPAADFARQCETLGAPEIAKAAAELAAKRGAK